MVILNRRQRAFAKGEFDLDLTVGSARWAAELERADPGRVFGVGEVREGYTEGAD